MWEAVASLSKVGEFYQKSYLRVAPGSIAEKEPEWLLSDRSWQVTHTGVSPSGPPTWDAGGPSGVGRAEIGNPVGQAARRSNKLRAVGINLETTSVFGTTAEAPAARASFAT